LLFPADIEKLKEIGKYDDRHVKDITIKGKEVKTIKKKEDSTQCIFWDDRSKKCSIYKNRPFDCMIYPFDIFPIDGKYYWIVYSCNPKSDWKWSESTLQTFENSDEFAGILENIDTYSHLEYDLRTKVDKTGYSVIREVNFSKLRNK
jgi:Fe-S-cluster containining protein